MTNQDAKAVPGWYEDAKNPGMLRRWDGVAWTEDRRPRKDRRGSSRSERRESTGGSLIATGLLMAVVAGVLSAAAGFDADEAGWFIFIVGVSISQCFLLTGIIAKGVEIGMRTYNNSRA